MDDSNITKLFPTIVEETTYNMWKNDLIQLLSTKPPTDSCVTAARKRMTFNHLPDWSDVEDVSPIAKEHNKGVPIEMEIKTALFLAKTKQGEEVFIAVHTPANKNVTSNGIIKSELREQLGIEISGNMDKNRALPVLNGKLKTLLDSFETEDRQRLDELKKILVTAKKSSSLHAYVEPLEAHIKKPEIEFGELNPWTLLMLATYSADKDWQNAGAKETKVIHMIDSELATREGVSTTNAGSRNVSMAITDTARAFAFLEFGLKRIYGDDRKAFMVSDRLEKEKQL